jgi:ribonuclease T2
VLADGEAGSPKGRTEYILAVSWQPGFCETRPKRKECAGQTAERYDATHFSLHGLWPMKKSYCGVAADTRRATGWNCRNWRWPKKRRRNSRSPCRERNQVSTGINGFAGTCQGGTAQDDFAVQLRLLDELNGSAVRSLFTEPLGQEVTEGEVKQAFETSFGKGAGDRVRMRCQKARPRSVITGLTIGLSGNVSAGAGLSPLILAAGETDLKCGSGIVDAAGIQ